MKKHLFDWLSAQIWWTSMCFIMFSLKPDNPGQPDNRRGFATHTHKRIHKGLAKNSQKNSQKDSLKDSLKDSQRTHKGLIKGFTKGLTKGFKKAIVWLVVRSKWVKKHLFYCVVAPTNWTSICFIGCPLQNDEKPYVLLCFRSAIVKQQRVF